MKERLERLLDVDAELLGRGVLLCSCLFLVISDYVIGRVARDSLFLARFQAVQLPYADITSGVLVGFVVAGYLRLGRRTSLRNLLVGSQLFYATNCTLFWAVEHFYRPRWLVPLFYVWVGIFGVLAPTQVWTLANYVLTTREAKRIFAIVGSGAILGWIFAGFASKLAVRAFGAESLLLWMIPFFLFCSALMAAAWNRGKFRLADVTESSPEVAGADQKDLLGSIRLVLSSPYLRAIAIVICMSSFVTTLTGWQFKAIAKQFLVSQDRLAIFFGDFYLYAGVAAFLFQLFLTTRFLRRFGIGTMLFVLPLAVLLGSIGLLVAGSLVAAVALKGSDQVLRYSIDRSAVELLYLPLPHRLKLQTKWLIDTVIWRLGDGLAGIVVLILATGLHLAPSKISWVALLLVAAWLAAVSITGKQYIAVLQESITKHRFNAEQSSALALDRSTSELLADRVRTSDPGEILYALGFFEAERTRAPHPVVRNLLRHPAAEVRRKALSILSASADKSVLPAIQQLLRDPDIGVRTEAMLYLVHHANVDPLVMLEQLSEFEDFSVRSAVAAYLARPGRAQSLETAKRILEGMVAEQGVDGQRARAEAARLLGELPDSFDPLLSSLLRDSEGRVVREAVRSTGMLRKEELIPELLELLNDPDIGAEAAQALSRFGNVAIHPLRKELEGRTVPLRKRTEIPSVLASIGTPAAAHVLLENLLDGDTMVRFKTISGLNKLHRDHPEIELDLKMLETVLAAEILGHYRSYQIMEVISAPGNSQDPVVAALGESLQQELERIFRLLGLLYPQLDLHSAYLGLQSSDKTVYDNALEFLENVLKPQLRAQLIPLLDGRITPRDRAAFANRIVYTNFANREEAVSALVGCDDPWLKSCGAYAIGSFGMKSLAGELETCLNHPDPLLRETARAAKLRLERFAAGS